MKKIFFLFFVLLNLIVNANEIKPEDININYKEAKNLNLRERVTDKKIDFEVLYFFSYSCPSCYHFKPYLNQWLKIKKENVKFTPIAVNFRESWEETSKAYYINETLNIENFDEKIYNHIHLKENKIFFKEDLYNFIKKESNISESDFNKIYNSLSLKMKEKKATEITDYFEVMGTPTFVILTKNKSYMTNISITGDPLSTIVSLEYLVRNKKE